MVDPRIRRLADLLVNYSVKVKKGERVLIQDTNAEPEFVKALVGAVHEAGGLAFVALRDKAVERELFLNGAEEQFALQARFELERMKEMDAFIGFTSLRNAFAWKDIPADKMDLYNKYIWKKVHIEQRVPHTRWVVLRYPSPAMAQNAAMSEAAFEDFFFDVCTMDYSRMSKAMDPLVKLLENTDKVRVLGPGTDLAFSIKGLPAIKCDGTMNIPDGEVYTAPVRDSVNGILSYNTPSEKDGFKFEQVRFEFKDGKIVDARANDTKRVNAMLDIDEGARYLGEFAFGINPYITQPLLDTLFDEKIAGSVHITPGNSYDDCFNGNRSSLHWDLVLKQDEAAGGGEIWLDGRLARKDGRFALPELEGLNPENLT
ncbi:MAG TPA: aminopeptidase [Rectinemataceae bacterium]|nr:aminopeptidase [Rectinemataceae bacterium]